PEQKHHLDPSPKTPISTRPPHSLLPSNLRNKQPNQRCSAEAVTGPCMSVAGVGVLVLRPTRDGTDLSVSRMYFYSARKMSKTGAAVVKTEDSGVVIGRVGLETAPTPVSVREKW
ncbi:unnamed protein product, partial [Musa acuminata var. zebrina]